MSSLSHEAPKVVPWRDFSELEQLTWSQLFRRLESNRRSFAVPEFQRGIDYLGMSADRIPDLDQVNRQLWRATGWQAVPVEGLESSGAFYPMLAARQYPIGCFLRDACDLNYTPAPDIFHDLYGHMPFFIDPAYASFCQKVGVLACQYLDQPPLLRQFERLFWFTIEFGLLETPGGRRLFGGGILSSYSESLYALSPEPTVLPFNVETIRRQEFRIDDFQRTLFLLPNREALFGCLAAFERGLGGA